MADRSASQGPLLATLHGILLSIVCIAIMPSFLQKFTNDPDIISIGIRYSGIAFCFAVMQAWGLVFEKVYQAIGRMTLTMVCLLSGCVLHRTISGYGDRRRCDRNRPGADLKCSYVSDRLPDTAIFDPIFLKRYET